MEPRGETVSESDEAKERERSKRAAVGCADDLLSSACDIERHAQRTVFTPSTSTVKRKTHGLGHSSERTEERTDERAND